MHVGVGKNCEHDSLIDPSKPSMLVKGHEHALRKVFSHKYTCTHA